MDASRLFESILTHNKNSQSNRSRKRFSFPAPLGSGPFRGPLFFQGQW